MSPWIKVRDDLHEDTNVLRLSDICRTEVEHTVGMLVRFWSWAGRQTPDGTGLVITAARLDRLVNHPGFTAGMLEIGWLAGTDGDFQVPHFDRHNSANAKARAMEAEAKRLRRLADKEEKDRQKGVGQNVGHLSDPVSDQRREEKRRSKEEGLSPAREREDSPAPTAHHAPTTLVPFPAGPMPATRLALIERIVAAYPKQQGVPMAMQILDEIAKDDAELANILARTEAIAAVIATRSDADKLRLKAAHTFFGERRYLDDPETYRSARTLEAPAKTRPGMDDREPVDEWDEEQLSLGPGRNR